MITDPTLSAVEYVSHGFFTRRDGVSTGIFQSRNCGFGSADDAGRVQQNRARISALINLKEPERLLTAHQVHSAIAVRVNAPWTQGKAPKADAMVTDQPGIGLGILTADCAPVLFATRSGRPVVAAAHAGWRGALGGVLENTLQVMLQVGACPDQIIAVIGPCIGRASYEVGADFPQPFIEESPESERFFTAARKHGHYMFDIGGYAAWRLARAGVKAVRITGQDTMKENDLFFSYRRACLSGERDCGRQISAIAIKPMRETQWQGGL